MNFYSVPNLIAGIFCVLIGLLVFLRNRTKPVNIAFLILTSSVAIWQVGTFKVLQSTDAALALWWCKFTYWGAVFIPVATYHLVVYFLGKVEQKKYVITSYLIGIFIFLPLSQTKYLLNGVYEYFWGYWFKAGILHPVYLLFFANLMMASFMNLFFAYRKETFPLQKLRIKFLSIALGIAYLGVVDFPSDYGVTIYPCGYLFILIYLTIIAYSIIRYRLIDVSVAITRTGLFALIYSLVIGVPFSLAIAGKQWLLLLFGPNWWLAPMMLMAVLATGGPFLYTFLQTKAENILLREQRKYQEILKESAVEIVGIRNVVAVFDLLVKILSEGVKISRFGIYLLSNVSQSFEIQRKYNVNLKNKNAKLISGSLEIVKWLEEHKIPIVYEEIKRQANETKDLFLRNVEEEMRDLDANVIIPSFLEGKLSVIFVLGSKASGGIYTSEDLHAFSVLASQVALAVDNAFIYENMQGQVKQRSDELMNVQKQLVQAEKLATVGTLAGGVAHEINNPLAAILTNVQLLLDSDEIKNEDDRESLELIEEATKRCREIVKKLMVYARKPLAKEEISRVDLGDVIGSVLSFIKYQLEQEDIKIATNVKKNDFFVMGNKNEIEHVITNIVLNGKDAIKKIKKSGTIGITLVKTKEFVKIQISDEGSGISKEVRTKIFDPFFTTKDVGKGLGLGLSICQAIIERHKGKIEVESELNKGTVFTLQLPGAL